MRRRSIRLRQGETGSRAHRRHAAGRVFDHLVLVFGGREFRRTAAAASGWLEIDELLLLRWDDLENPEQPQHQNHGMDDDGNGEGTSAQASPERKFGALKDFSCGYGAILH